MKRLFSQANSKMPRNRHMLTDQPARHARGQAVDAERYVALEAST